MTSLAHLPRQLSLFCALIILSHRHVYVYYFAPSAYCVPQLVELLISGVRSSVTRFT